MSISSPPEAPASEEVERLRERVAELERQLASREKALPDERQLLQGIIQKSPVAIAVMRGPDFVYELVNPAYQALAPGKQMLGRPIGDVWPEVAEDYLSQFRD